MSFVAEQNSELFASLDSFEGVPDWFEPRTRPEERAAWQQRLYNLLVWIGLILPGIGLAWGLAWVGRGLSTWIGTQLMHTPPGKDSPISPIILAILLGLIIRNTIGVP